MATIKHFIANEQEMWRMYNIIQPAYSSNVGKTISPYGTDHITNLGW